MYRICEDEGTRGGDGRADMYLKDGLHLSGKRAAVFADELSAAVESGVGSITFFLG